MNGNRIINVTDVFAMALFRWLKKSVQLAAPPAFTDYWLPMSGLVGQLASRQPQDALPKRLPMDWPSNNRYLTD